MSGLSEKDLRDQLADRLWSSAQLLRGEAGDPPGYVGGPRQAFVNGLLPLVVAYGDQRAAQALREAARACNGLRSDLGMTTEKYVLPVNVHAWLSARADEIGKQP